ncbi:MAG: PKD domain-containing protein [Acidobacteriota bacterium]|nr:PKD domain-containing protein [Acidobacteriota bacterium]
MEDPSVALNDAGEAVLAWTECGNRLPTLCGPGAGASVELATASADQLANPVGVAFAAAQPVPVGATGAQYRPRVALNDAEVALAWDELPQSGRDSSLNADAAAEPLSSLNAGTPAWQRLLDGQPAASTATLDVSPRIAIDAQSNVTLAWQAAGSNGDSTVHATTVSSCAATCGSSATVALDPQAAAAGRLSLAAAPDGDALLSWTSYAPSGGALPTVVAATYDPGPTLSEIQIPGTATAGTAASFSVRADDHWTALEGPVVTRWDFGDGTTATGSSVSHTYTTAGDYTVTVTATTAAAQTTVTAAARSTLTQQIVVASAVAHAAPKVTTPLTGVAAWGSRTGVRTISADMTVPALSCGGNGRVRVGQQLGIRLWGSRVTASSARVLADFAGVDVECRYAGAFYRPSFTVADVGNGTSAKRRAKLSVAPGDLLQLAITDSSSRARLSIADLSTPGQRPAVVTGPSLATGAGWQVGAFPIPGVPGPYATLPTSFTNVTAGGTGIASLTGLQRSRWNGASVTQVGSANNQLSVVYASVPRAPRGGSIAAPAHGQVRYRRPGSHHWTRLIHNTGLPANTLFDATGGTVQLSNPEPQHQHQSVTAWGGEFTTSSNPQGNTSIKVTGTWTGGAQGAGARASAAAGHKRGRTVHGNLWAKGHGKFTTKGNYGAAAVLGTKWLTRNLKHGTLFKVAKNRYDHNDRIRVTIDYPRRHTVILSQGQSVVAPAPRVKPKPTKPAPFAFTLVGVKRVNGRYNVSAPGFYQLTLLSRTRPYYVDAAVAPHQPGGGGSWFYRDGSQAGEPRWEIHFALRQSLAIFQLWNVGIRIGGKLYVVPLRLR